MSDGVADFCERIRGVINDVKRFAFLAFFLVAFFMTQLLREIPQRPMRTNAQSQQNMLLTRQPSSHNRFAGRLHRG